MWMEEDKREKNDGRRMRMRNGGVMHVTVAGWGEGGVEDPRQQEQGEPEPGMR